MLISLANLTQAGDSLPRFFARFHTPVEGLSLRTPEIAQFVQHLITVQPATDWTDWVSAASALVSAAFIVLTYFVVIEQKDIANRQADIAAEQAAIAKRQTSIEEDMRRERMREAVGRFYRAAHDLATELQKVDGIEPRGPQLAVDFNTHPRQVLRNASLEFAPLGDRAVHWLNDLGRAIDTYFTHVLSWNELPRRTGGRTRLRVSTPKDGSSESC